MDSLLIKPVAPIDQVVEAWESYLELKNRLLTDDDYQTILGRRYIKKSGWRKIQTAFGISNELVKEERKDYGRYFVYEVTVKVIAQNGRFAFGVGSCSSNERNFAHVEHDTRSTAFTRSLSRALSDLVGAGEVSAEEMVGEIQDETPTPAPARTPNHNWFEEVACNPAYRPVRTEEQNTSRLLSDKQRALLVSLINERIMDPGEREEQLQMIDSLTKSEAYQLISDMLNNKYN